MGSKLPSPLRAKRSRFSCIFRLQWCCRFQWSLFGGEQWCRRFHAGLHQRLQRRHWFQSWHVAVSCARKGSPCLAWCGCEREKVRPAWPGVGVSAKKFALLGLVRVRARKSSPCARKMARNRRFMVCWANFFAEMPLEGVCWAKCFANQQSCDPVGRTLSRRSPGSRPLYWQC